MATITTSNKPLYEGMKVTREEYLDLREDGFKYEMIDGVLSMSPSAFFKHNEILAEIVRQIGNYLFQHSAGKVVVETDIYLPDGGDVLRPDISIILKENYGIIIGHIHGVPDIVVEVLSAATKDRDLGIKADRYLRNGVKEYWIADPDKKTISLWININKKEWRKVDGNEISSSVLSGLAIKQEVIFLED